MDPDHIRYEPKAGPPGFYLPRQSNERQLREKELEANGFMVIDGYRGWGPIFYTRDPATCTGSGWQVFADLCIDPDDRHFQSLRIAAGYCIDAPEKLAAGSTYSHQTGNTTHIAPAVAKRFV